MMPADLRLGTMFTAVWTDGKRYAFKVVERATLGDGWMCLNIDGLLQPGVYWSGQMRDIKAKT